SHTRNASPSETPWACTVRETVLATVASAMVSSPQALAGGVQLCVSPCKERHQAILLHGSAGLRAGVRGGWSGLLQARKPRRAANPAEQSQTGGRYGIHSPSRISASCL